MSNMSELREMSDDQLMHELRESQKQLFQLRFQAATEKLDAPSSLKRLRRGIARIKTLQTQRKSQLKSEPTTSEAATSS